MRDYIKGSLNQVPRPIHLSKPGIRSYLAVPLTPRVGPVMNYLMDT